jgi:hypothetical protein
MFTWYAAGVIAAISIAWLAALLQKTGNAPIGLFSLGVGAAIGAILAGIAAILRIAGLRPLLIGTLLLSIVAIVAEHAWLYHDFRRQWQEERERSATVAMFRPETPASAREYFARQLTARNTALWAADAVLVVAAAIATVLVAQCIRQPMPTFVPDP